MHVQNTRSSGHLQQAIFDAAHFARLHCPHARAYLARPRRSPLDSGITSVARKLTEGVFAVWARGEVFDPAKAFPVAKKGRAM